MNEKRFKTKDNGIWGGGRPQPQVGLDGGTVNCHECPLFSNTSEETDVRPCERKPLTFKYCCVESKEQMYADGKAYFCRHIRVALTTRELKKDCPLDRNI